MMALSRKVLFSCEHAMVLYAGACELASIGAAEEVDVQVQSEMLSWADNDSSSALQRLMQMLVRPPLQASAFCEFTVAWIHLLFVVDSRILPCRCITCYLL
jgi:hypothetical protein